MPDDEHIVQPDPRMMLGTKAREHMPKRYERGGELGAVGLDIASPRRRTDRFPGYRRCLRRGSTSRNGGGLAEGLLSIARAPAQRSGGNRESSSSMNVGIAEEIVSQSIVTSMSL